MDRKVYQVKKSAEEMECELTSLRNLVKKLEDERDLLLAMLNQQALQDNQDRLNRYSSPYPDEFYNA